MPPKTESYKQTNSGMYIINKSNLDIFSRRLSAYFDAWLNKNCFSKNLWQSCYLCSDGGLVVQRFERSRDHEFESQSGCCQVATTWMGDCLQTGKPSRQTVTDCNVDRQITQRIGREHDANLACSSLEPLLYLLPRSHMPKSGVRYARST